MLPYVIALLFLGPLVFPAPSHAAGLNRVIASKPPVPSKKGTAPQFKVLWDHWYTVTVGSNFHYEYYNDHAEIREGRIVFLNRAWKLEENYINEEQAGAFALDNEALTPLFFNFHSNYRSTETFIDGNVKENGELTVKVRRGSQELPLIKKMIPNKTFFSLHFPVWLGKNLSRFKPGETNSFGSILEDNLDANYSRVIGQVRVEPSDEFAKKTHTTRISLNYQDVKSTWYVEENGAPIRVEMPAQQAIIERSTREKAEVFLKN